jgi:predicted PurR-regulated permease PerM
MNFQLSSRWIAGAAILASALWVVHGFIQPILAAGVIAIASWPLYLRFAGRVPRRLGATAAPALFTAVVTSFVLAPIVFALGALPRPGVWAAITGVLAAVPFMGYVALLALALRMAVMGLAAPALLSAALGCAILLCGDKVVRPAVARSGLHLPFAWVLMGCLGGFEVLGLVGLVTGPVLLRIAAEIWKERVREPAR